VALGSIGQAAIPALMTALKDPSELVRSRAAIVLGRTIAPSSASVFTAEAVQIDAAIKKLFGRE